ncbi:MAG: SAM-dependent methyltransferase [Sulfurospirillum sp.]|nr:SAM-dependent methyltransferase [Sulfurospirillum sp.]
MNRFFEENDTCSALEAQYNAQRIAFAPIIFQTARSMRDLGVLKALYEHKEGMSVDALAKETGLSRYGLITLLETALSADIVKQEDECYFITKTGYFLLNDPMTIANMNYNHHVNYQGLFWLDKAIVSGKPEGLKVFGSWESIYPALSSLPEDAQQSWFRFDHFYSDGAFPEAVQKLLALKPKRILDVGGNTGKFSMLVAKSDAQVQMSIMDLPEQLALAKVNIQKEGLEKQISLLPSNVLSPEHHFPKGFDIIWMSQFLDCFSEEMIVMILSKAKEAMDEHTRLCIMEPFWDRQRFETSAYCIINTSPYFTAMANGYSKMYHSKDFIALIERAGLTIETIDDYLGVCQSLLYIRHLA